MNTIALNTIEYINELESAGLDERMAKVHATALARIIDNNLATKRDIKELETKLEMRIALAKKDTVIQLSIIMAAMAGVCTTVLGILLAVR